MNSINSLIAAIRYFVLQSKVLSGSPYNTYTTNKKYQKCYSKDDY
ncbi:hypothetical protein THERMOT_682 [Bathymodiolus thermophilus thioautotrophic gill symbiont]|nr:hypothetical protein [Bathymodiolus thermophilus thioautotrophic gill symbiont]CAB5497364.1 hypothetical protein THERMOT_682 [Bathymodiolus thermophilus thioautotrophic gill symbiont]